MNTEYKTSTFDPDTSFKPIEAESTHIENLNYSSILTELIHAAGRYCERYASDLFIDWEAVIENMHDPDSAGFVRLFGFREDGVDNNDYILNHYNRDSTYARHYYRALYRLDFAEYTNEDEFFDSYTYYKLTLTKLSRW